MTAGKPRAPGLCVVVGVDGSLNSVVALGWAARQAHRTGARLLVVRSWQPAGAATALFGRRARTREEAVEEAARDLESALRHTFGLEPVDLGIDVAVMAGGAGPALVAAARDASLLVVGTRGHGPLAGVLLGSVSTYCVQRAHCPVVVVPTPPTAEAERLYPVAAPHAHTEPPHVPAQPGRPAGTSAAAPVGVGPDARGGDRT